MREHFYRIAAVLAALTAIGTAASVPAKAAPKPAVDTIVLETEEAGGGDVPVDIGWKTSQDKGKWIDDMGIADSTNSLVLIINDQEDPGDRSVFAQKITEGKKRPQRTEVPGNSRLYYLSRGDDAWKIVMEINCSLSGGEDTPLEDLYGAYSLECGFGSLENPGSLVPYHQLNAKDYWISDPSAEGFGHIQNVPNGEPESDAYVNLEEMKAFSNYGMILKPEDGSDGYPALIVNCQQADTIDRSFCSVQLSQTNLLVLLQSIDEDTRILIAGSLEDLEGM